MISNRHSLCLVLLGDDRPDLFSFSSFPAGKSRPDVVDHPILRTNSCIITTAHLSRSAARSQLGYSTRSHPRHCTELLQLRGDALWWAAINPPVNIVVCSLSLSYLAIKSIRREIVAVAIHLGPTCSSACCSSVRSIADGYEERIKPWFCCCCFDQQQQETDSITQRETVVLGDCHSNESLVAMGCSLVSCSVLAFFLCIESKERKEFLLLIYSASYSFYFYDLMKDADPADPSYPYATVTS